MAMLKVENLSIKYGSIEAVKNVSFEVNEGEVVTLIGANGAGKTSILRTISGLVRPTEGTISYLGNDIHKTPARKIVAEGLAQVPEGRHVFAGLTVMENLEMGAFLHTNKEENAALLKKVFQRFPRLEERKNQDAATLSGGEQQRVGIIRALAANPEVVLMDEPFSALDPVVRKQLQDLLLNLHDQLNKTVIFVTHDMQEAIRLGNTIGVLHKGVLEQVGKPREILRHPATKFVREFFAGNRINQKLDLETLLKSELGVDPRFYLKVETLVRYHVYSVQDLIKDCSNHPDSLFIAETEFGEFLIEPKRVWNFFLKWVAGND